LIIFIILVVFALVGGIILVARGNSKAKKTFGFICISFSICFGLYLALSLNVRTDSGTIEGSGLSQNNNGVVLQEQKKPE
jgi:hypothetical protein